MEPRTSSMASVKKPAIALTIWPMISSMGVPFRWCVYGFASRFQVVVRRYSWKIGTGVQVVTCAQEKGSSWRYLGVRLSSVR